MTASSRAWVLAVAAAVGLAIGASSGRMLAQEPALTLRALVSGAAGEGLTIELLRWSTDAERAPLLTALSAPVAVPAPAAGAGAAGGRGGRAARGGRGGRAAGPPPSPSARLTAAIKVAPTVGFIWGDGPTGYSVKYAWRAVSPDGRERVVLATDRRLGAHSPAWPAASRSAADLEFTVIELRLDSAAGRGEGRASLHAAVVVDAAAATLALDAYDAAPVLFTVTR